MRSAVKKGALRVAHLTRKPKPRVDVHLRLLERHHRQLQACAERRKMTVEQMGVALLVGAITRLSVDKTIAFFFSEQHEA
jgi:hypothetical protein